MSIVGGYNQIYVPKVFVKALNRLSADITDNIISFEYQEDPQKMDLVTITVANPDFVFSNDPRFKTGVGYDLRWGYDYDLSEIKQFVTARAEFLFPDASGFPTIKLEAGGFQKLMNFTGKPRNWANVTSLEIAKKIAEQYGLVFGSTPERWAQIYVNPVQAADRKPSRVQSADMTDFQFLSSLAKKLNWEFYVEDGTLYFEPFQYDRPADEDLVFSYREDRTGTLLSFEPSYAKKPGLVAVAGTDPKTGKSSAVTKKPGVTGVVNSEGFAALIGRNVADLDYWAQSQGQTRPTNTTKIQNKNSPLTIASPYETDTLLNVQAEALSTHLNLSASKATATFIGSPRIRARKVIRVYNVGPYSGNWLVTNTQHRITAESGYTVTATLARADNLNKDGSKKKATQASTNTPRPRIAGAVQQNGSAQLVGRQLNVDKR